ncbi:MAG: phosphodiester glycosidase family protein [Bacteroidaceae bacterium]
MKTLFSFFIIALLWQTSSAQGTIILNNTATPVDTLQYYQVGPQSYYAELYFPSYPMYAYMLTIHLDDTNNAIETFQAKDKIGQTEALTSAYSRLESNSKHPIAGINANFWTVAGQGQPNELIGTTYSGNASNGELITEPSNWNRGHGSIGFVTLDDTKKVSIGDFNFEGSVVIPNKGAYTIANVNRFRGENELVFYNHFVGSTTRSNPNGIEVAVIPENNNWTINKEMKGTVTRILENDGQNELLDGEVILSGAGDAKTFLSQLAIGDQVNMQLGAVNISNNDRPNIKQMVTGNALVMQHGELTERNTNESYNAMLYPRTGIGCSTDGKQLYLIVIDKKNGTAGATTTTMCHLLKAAGATEASTMDGGGSAQMMLKGEIKNYPADGKERPVANGWMLFSTAPEESTVATIDFADYHIELPQNSTFSPRFLGYNAYGDWVDKDVKGVTLTCDASLGTIIGDTLLVANDTGEGNLVAHYQGKTKSKHIQIVEAPMALRLHHVIIDNNNSYPIDIYASANGKDYTIASNFIHCDVTDQNICMVENGVIKAIKNGTTTVKVAYQDFEDTLTVDVQMPAERWLPLTSWKDGWKISSNIKNSEATILSTSDQSAVLNFTYQSARAPYILLENEMPCYGIPQKIQWKINTNATTLTKMVVTIRTNMEEDNRSFTYNNLPPNQNNAYEISIGDVVENSKDLALYPIYLHSIKLFIQSTGMNVGEQYQIDLTDCLLEYDAASLSAIEEKERSTPNQWSIVNNPTQNNELLLKPLNQIQGITTFSIYNVQGKCVYQQTERAKELYILHLPTLVDGEYIVQCSNKQKVESYKLLIQ